MYEQNNWVYGNNTRLASPLPSRFLPLFLTTLDNHQRPGIYHARQGCSKQLALRVEQRDGESTFLPRRDGRRLTVIDHPLWRKYAYPERGVECEYSDVGRVRCDLMGMRLLVWSCM